MAVSVVYNTFTTSSNFKTHIYTDDGGSFSSNLATSTAFDYFPDVAAVNDAIYFGSQYFKFKDVRIYVGTQFAADAVTFTWEYYNGSSWVALSSVTNSDAFTKAGQQDITWTIPSNWINTTVNGVNAVWIRARVSAVTNPTEGGAQSTQVVQVGDHTITVSGGTEAAPADITDIQSANDTGGWGLCTTAGNGIKIDCHLTIKDYFEISWGYIKTNDGRLETAAGSNVTIAESTVNIYCPRYGLFHVVSWNGTVDVTDSAVFNSNDRLSISVDGAFTRSRVSCGTGDVLFNNAGLTIVNCYFTPSSSVVLQTTFYTAPIDFSSSCLVRGAVTSVTLDGGEYPSFETTAWTGGTYTLLDPDSMPTLSIQRGQHYIYVKYRYDLKVIDKEGNGIYGAVVTITDKNGAQVFSTTTAVSGDITQQQITYRQYDSGGASPGQSSPPINDNTFSPHTVTISKAGYITKTIKYTMDRKREEIEVLEKVKDLNFSKKGRFITQ